MRAAKTRSGNNAVILADNVISFTGFPNCMIGYVEKEDGRHLAVWGMKDGRASILRETEDDILMSIESEPSNVRSLFRREIDS